MKYLFVISGLFLSILSASLLLNSCRKQDQKANTTPLPLPIPNGFPAPVYNFDANPVSEEGFVLGRKLFYDGRLSKDGNYPCASCHTQMGAFATFDHDLSHGYNNSHTTRNAPGIANLAWFTAYLQDGSSNNLEAISLAHITSPTDMGETMDNVVNKLKVDTAYKRLFRAAYGSEQVNSDRILNSLSQFVIQLVSANTKYDRMRKGEATFTTAEQNGYQLFKSKCATCHAEPLFSDFSYRNIGLELNPFLKDYGRMRVTGNRNDSLKFRVPSLRNVGLTGTYMHDGRLGTLRNVLSHYRTGIKQGPTLDPLLTNGIALSDTQVEELVAFLRTLSDSSYLTNPRFADQ